MIVFDDPVEVVIAPGFVGRQAVEAGAEIPGGAGRPVAAAAAVVVADDFVRTRPTAVAPVGSASLPQSSHKSEGIPKGSARFHRR